MVQALTSNLRDNILYMIRDGASAKDICLVNRISLRQELFAVWLMNSLNVITSLTRREKNPANLKLTPRLLLRILQDL